MNCDLNLEKLTGKRKRCEIANTTLLWGGPLSSMVLGAENMALIYQGTSQLFELIDFNLASEAFTIAKTNLEEIAEEGNFLYERGASAISSLTYLLPLAIMGGVEEGIYVHQSQNLEKRIRKKEYQDITKRREN